MSVEKLNLKPVEVVDDISKHDFTEKYLKPGIPLKIKNYAKTWPAIQKWTYEYLADNFGDQKVKLYGSWLENEPTRIEMPPVKEVLFKEYLALLKAGQPSDLRIFLFNPFALKPELLRDFTFTNIADGYLKSFPYLFFGSAGTDVRLHYDIDLSHVFITQFGGTKRIVLFGQDQTKYLYKMPFTTHSAADLSNPDFEKYPALKRATGYFTDLEPGETLFMPSGIWHYIQYLNGSFSLSLRALSANKAVRIKGVYNVLFVRKADQLLATYFGKRWANYKLKTAFALTNKNIKT